MSFVGPQFCVCDCGRWRSGGSREKVSEHGERETRKGTYHLIYRRSARRYVVPSRSARRGVGELDVRVVGAATDGCRVWCNWAALSIMAWPNSNRGLCRSRFGMFLSTYLLVSSHWLPANRLGPHPSRLADSRPKRKDHDVD